MTGVATDPLSWHLSLSPPEAIARARMIHRWEHLSFIHWPYRPEDVQALLPPGLAVHTFEGAAWVGLIPFVLRVRRPGLPYLPWVASMQETNVRTYVIGPDGRPGIWFLSLDAERLPAVLVARRWYRIPYQWSRMRLDRSEDAIRYSSRRRWPDDPGVRSDLQLDLGGSLRPDELTELDRFVTSRWRLFSPTPRGLAATQVQHLPWPLRRARVRSVHDELIAACGLPSPRGDPTALHSAGVEVRFARRELLGAMTEASPSG